MRKILTITILMCGLAGGAMAQNSPSSTQNPQTADKQSTYTQKEQKEAAHKEAAHKPNCKANQQSNAQTQASDPAPQNVIEYGG
jgi:hypothetical protein